MEDQMVNMMLEIHQIMENLTNALLFLPLFRETDIYFIRCLTLSVWLIYVYINNLIDKVLYWNKILTL